MSNFRYRCPQCRLRVESQHEVFINMDIEDYEHFLRSKNKDVPTHAPNQEERELNPDGGNDKNNIAYANFTVGASHNNGNWHTSRFCGNLIGLSIVLIIIISVIGIAYIA